MSQIEQEKEVSKGRPIYLIPAGFKLKTSTKQISGVKHLKCTEANFEKDFSFRIR